jgi:2-deoxystreptamine N-acetyl-D-glucosaminyltransferase/2-deoxystreptamine glucosyltransferase
MAAGLPVICTDSDGNRDFIEDGVNCLLVDDDPESVAAAIKRLFAEPELRARLAEGGRATAARYELQGQLDKVAGFYEQLAPSPVARETGTASA